MLIEKLQSLKATLEACTDAEQRAAIQGDIERVRLALFHEGELNRLVQFCAGEMPASKTYPDDEQRQFEAGEIERRNQVIEREGRQLPTRTVPRVDPAFEALTESDWEKIRNAESKPSVEAPRQGVYPQPLPEPLPKSEAQLEANRVLACKNEAKRVLALQKQSANPSVAD